MKRPFDDNPKNPMTGQPLTDLQVERVEQYRTVRRNAKRAARSGNPAKSAPAKSVLERLPAAFVDLYLGV